MRATVLAWMPNAILLAPGKILQVKDYPFARASRFVTVATESTMSSLPVGMQQQLDCRVTVLLEDCISLTEADYLLDQVLGSEMHNDPAMERRLLNLAGSAAYRALCGESVQCAALSCRWPIHKGCAVPH